MTNGFVWFHNHSARPKEARAFYSKLLGWKSEDGPSGLTMFTGDKGPFAGLAAQQGDAGWLPYVEVDDVDRATAQAVELGATILAKKSKGPAGDFSVVRDPGGASVALWRRS